MWCWSRTPPGGAPRPPSTGVVVRTVENTAALEANLLSGTVDMIAGELGLTLDQALAFEQRHGEDWQIAYRPGLIYEHIDLNLSNPVLADRRVRQGLLWALDRQALSDQLFAGRQPVAHTSVSPLDWVHDDGIKTYTRDPRIGRSRCSRRRASTGSSTGSGRMPRAARSSSP